MNKWLTSTVKAHNRLWGKTDKPVVWEVGSRDGHDCYELAQRIYAGKDEWFWSNATLVAFEPNPDQATVIKKNYPEIEVMELAASNKNGRKLFMVYHGDEGAVGSSSLNLKWKEGDLDGHRINVVTTRLEGLITEPIDIMKIDVEGYGYQALEGIGDKLKLIKVIHIETETWTGSDKKVELYMKERNWELVDVMEEWGGMPDQVWVNPFWYEDKVVEE